jgi:two-component system, OmpR family, sensor kinase
VARLPIRWKLTAWYALLSTAALVVFGGVIYFGLRRELNDGLNEQIDRQALLIERSVSMSGDQPVIDLTGLADPDDEQFMRAWGLDGQLLSESGGTARIGALDADVAEAAREGQTIRSAQSIDGTPFLIRTGPIERDGEVVAVLQVGASREDVVDTLGRLRWVLSIAAPALFLIAVGGGYVLAGRALAPVAAITDVAGSIRGPDLGARLTLDLPDDELGRLANTFNAMLGRIEEAFERQRRFTGDAAHELRTPLSLMQSRVDLALARPRSGEQYRDELERLNLDLQRLTGLVGSLLTVARSDAGELALEPIAFDLADLVALVGEQYQSSATDADVELRMETVSTPVVADQDGLVQVLVNLVDNALAHTPTGGAITIGCRPEGDVVRLWVEDTGSGIAPEHRERVFDRFYRVDTGRSRGVGGVGLGLSICRAVIEGHGGSIRIVPDDAGGTRVEAELSAKLP